MILDADAFEQLVHKNARLLRTEIVAIDYLVRAAFRVNYSPIRFLAIPILSPLKLKVKPTDLAPKIFASRLGLLCAVTGLLLFFIGRLLQEALEGL